MNYFAHLKLPSASPTFTLDTMAGVPHTLINENGTKGIVINDWTVLSHKTSILSSNEIDT
jgi:hypothetical protein